ncbi:hypothetical protein [Micromonospora sp. RP3T]|uniref:hypothetical protein n=1 Tax=Micromonospora sp. RP3T TaxID=2135446 RepID=UPI003D76118B
MPLGVALGDQVPISELPGLDEEQIIRYQGFGYEKCRVTTQDVFSLCRATVSGSPGFTAAAVDAFLYAIEPNINSSNNWMINEKAWQQRDIRWLIQTLGLNPARLIGLSFYNCATFLGALDLGSALIRAGSANTCLATVAGVANEHSPRIPHAFHVQSDGAASFLVTSDSDLGDRYRVLAHRVEYVNPAEFRALDGTVDETRYFSLKALKIRATIERLLAQAALASDQIDMVFVQNLGVQSMIKYGRLCGVPGGRVWLSSLAENAHVIGVDSLVNFHHYHRTRPPGPGTVLIVGTSGMSWGGVVLRHES